MRSFHARDAALINSYSGISIPALGYFLRFVLDSMEQAITFELEAKIVTAERADSYWQVGFADDPVDTTEYLLLQRDVEDREQEIRLGMATHYVEINGQGASCYGCISTFDLQASQLMITFAPEGAARLGCEQARITFDLSPDELHKLKDILRRVFAASDVCTTGLG